VNRPTVVIAESIAEAGINSLRETCDVEMAVGEDRTRIIALLSGANAIIVRSATVVDAEMIDAAPGLQVIGRAGIGVDNIDVDAATAAGVLVVNAPNANTISAAEHTMAVLLAQARRVPEADASLRAGRWVRKDLQGVELHGKTLGILGLGKIGTLVAQRAAAFGMSVVAYDPFVGPDRARRLGVELSDLDTVIVRADFLTVHLPRNRETEGLIGEEAIAKMKPTASIINVARGGIVDERALADAIEQGRLAGAAIDVFAVEPATDSPLFALPQVVVTPHLGASTREAQDKAGTAVAESVARALRGELVLSAVNLDLGPDVSDEMLPFLSLAERLGAIFVRQAKGLPGTLDLCARGRIAEDSVRPLTLSVLKGSLAQVSAEAVSYVNAPMLAAAHGLTVVEESYPDTEGYQSVVHLSGTVDGVERSVAGTILAGKGPVLIEVDGYEIEISITDHMLLVRNDDVPGVIGRVGTFLGDREVNISNMAVGRSPEGYAAMMGISLDQPLGEDQIEDLMNVEGILAARYVDLA
jgi:D-3-phosphoglycerate dehydrogenase